MGLHRAAPAAMLPQGGKGVGAMLHRIPTVLVVDDEPVVRNLMADVLRMNGYQPSTARHGAEALEMCGSESGPPDLLVTDVMMPPFFNGLELVRRLRYRKPDLKVLYVSAFAGDPLLSGIFEDIHADFLPKPLSPIVLFHRVERMLEGTPGAYARDRCRRRGTVLLCIADPTHRQRVRECLRSTGIWVLDAAHPAEAQFLGQWHDGPIHLLMTDPGKPGQRHHWSRPLREIRPGMGLLLLEEAEDGLRLTPDATPPGSPDLWENVRQSLSRALI